MLRLFCIWMKAFLFKIGAVYFMKMYVSRINESLLSLGTYASPENNHCSGFGPLERVDFQDSAAV